MADTHQKKQQRLKQFLQTIGSKDEIANEMAVRANSVTFESIESPTMAQAVNDYGHLTTAALEKVVQNDDLSQEEMASLEAIVLPRERPVSFIINNTFSKPDSPWEHFDQSDKRKHIERAIRSIGRVDLPGNFVAPFLGTAFVVGEGLLMTNRHVAEFFATGVGTNNLRFREGQTVAWDPRREKDDPPGESGTMLKVTNVVMIHAFWDMALLRVDGLTSDQRPLQLSKEEPVIGREVAVIGYPAKDRRNDLKLQDQIFNHTFDVKRLQPGKVRARGNIESFKHNVLASTHDSSTLGGNSGSAVIDVETGQVIGLHFGGIYLKSNYAVPTVELSKDSDVVRVGVNFDRRPGPRQPEAAKDTTSRRTQAGDVARTEVSLRVECCNQVHEIPIEVSVSATRPCESTESVSGSILEATLKEPFVYPKLERRKGFDPGFLKDIDVPLLELTAKGEDVVARLEDSSYELKYHRFSVVIHKKRRLALFTAANVDWRIEKRTINGRKPTRKELDDIGDAQERWITDPRIPEAHQLPDVFYTKDAGAFDKGHLVRRDDVCWGSSFEDIQKGNGDTFHTTNCSPQVSGFNQSAKGEDNWGDLEELVARQAKAEKVIIFSGPVLRKDDLRFQGVDKHGDLLMQIPSSYWKIIVASGKKGPEAFGFVLKQDLSAVPLEFAVPREWHRYMQRISTIEKLLFGLVSLKSLKKFDQFDKLAEE